MLDNDTLDWGAVPGRPNAVKNEEIEMLPPEELALAFFESTRGDMERIEADVEDLTGEPAIPEVMDITMQIALRLIADEVLIGGRHRENGHVYVREAEGANVAMETLRILGELRDEGRLPEL